jgi:hypothetical protein
MASRTAHRLIGIIGVALLFTIALAAFEPSKFIPVVKALAVLMALVVAYLVIGGPGDDA